MRQNLKSSNILIRAIATLVNIVRSLTLQTHRIFIIGPVTKVATNAIRALIKIYTKFQIARMQNIDIGSANWTKMLETNWNHAQNAPSFTPHKELFSKNHFREGEVIAAFDPQGKIISQFSALFATNFLVQDSRTIKRQKSEISLVFSKGCIIVEKKFKGSDATRRFYCELAALYRIRNFKNGSIFPRILGIDIDNKIIRTDFLGPTFENASNISSIEQKFNLKITEDSTGKISTRKVRIEDKALLERVFHNLLHSGVVAKDIHIGNLVITQSDLAVIDFDSAWLIPEFFVNFKFARRVALDEIVDNVDVDISHNLMSYSKIKKELSRISGDSKTYAPFYLGYGLRIGNIFDLSRGQGKYDFIVKNVFKGVKKNSVVSFGANNLCIELNLLRDGTESIVAFELDEDFIDQANFLILASEWLNGMRPRIDLHNESFLNVTTLNIKFDVSLALNSIYYLESHEIYNIINWVRAQSKVVLLQANNSRNIGRASEDDYRKASFDFSLKILQNNNFKAINVYKPVGYSKPIVQGRSESNL